MRRTLLVTLAWALIQSQIQFLIFSRIGKDTTSIWFLAIFLIAILASLLIENFEQALRCWFFSILISMILVFLLLSLPILLGVFQKEFIPLIINSIIGRVLFITIIIIAPIGLLGCIIGQILRDRIL